jgi:hypothetical protein
MVNFILLLSLFSCVLDPWSLHMSAILLGILCSGVLQRAVRTTNKQSEFCECNTVHALGLLDTVNCICGECSVNWT